MRKLPVIIAAAATLCVFPALAGQLEAGSPGSEHMRGSMKGDLGEHKSYGYERESDMRRFGERGEGERYRHGEGMREGCKYITVRQRQGDEILVRHFKRCD